VVNFVKCFRQIDCTEIGRVTFIHIVANNIRLRTVYIAFLQPRPFLKPNWLSEDLRYDSYFSRKQYSNILDFRIKGRRPIHPSSMPFGHNRPIYMGPKLGEGCAPLGEGELGPHPIRRLGRILPPYQVTSWCIQGGGLCPFLGGRAGSSSSTMWPRPRPTSTPNAILIHRAVCPLWFHIGKSMYVGSRPSDHYFRSVCLFVCLFVQSYSQPTLIRFRSN